MTKVLLLASAAIGVTMMPLGGANAADFRTAPPAFDWSGFYAGVHAGWLNGDVRVHEDLLEVTGGNISGHVIGFLAGTNFYRPPTGPWVLGIEGDFGWASVHGTGGEASTDDVCDYLYDLNWDAHLRLRASYPMGGVRPFLAAGLALADLSISDCGALQEGGLYTGVTFGGGLDISLQRNVMLRGEVLWDSYGRKQYTDFSADFSAWTARAAVIWHFQ